MRDFYTPIEPIALGNQGTCWPNRTNAENNVLNEARKIYPLRDGLLFPGAEPPYVVSNPTCKAILPCGEEVDIGTKHEGLKGYLQHSRVAFDPTVSNANIEVLGNTYNQPVTGKLDFAYGVREDRLMAVLKVNGIIFDLGDVGEFKNIAYVLTKPFEAECADSIIKIYNPCDKYTIKAHTISALVGATYNGNPLISTAENPQTLDIDIDHPTRTFRLKSSPGSFVTARVKVDGEEKPVKMNFDITGRFENFPPVPQTKESHTHSECTEGGNASTLTLDARGSFDIYSSGALDYHWYEDYGLPTERLMGNTSTVQIWPQTLSYGVYNVALVLKDGVGGVAFDSLDLFVDDTTPPSLQPPPDVHAISIKGVPLVLDIGTPYSGDSCSPNVRVTNNAPSTGKFLCGETLVIWHADDYHGNITRAEQRVIVFCPRKSRKLSKGLSFLMDAIRNAKSGLDNCDGSRVCRADLRSLSPLVKTFSENLVEISGQQKERAEIGKDLRRIESALNEVHVMFEDAQRLPEIRLRRIRYEEAASQLEKVWVDLKRLMER